MNTIDQGHFLLNVITNAEDVSLFLENYNTCTADDALRGTAELDERPMFIYGSEKRHTLCKKKMPMRYKDAGLEYDESRIIYASVDNLKELVEDILGQLKSGELPDTKAKAEEPDEETPVIEESSDESGEVHIEAKETSKEDEGDSKPDLEVDEQIATEEKEAVKSLGVCRYGVPILEVEYKSPNVLGLKESMFVNVSEEDLSKFFDLVRGRVKSSIANEN